MKNLSHRMKGSGPETGRLWKSQQGLTLPEVSITLVILAILAAVSVPAYNMMVPGMRLRGETRNMVALLQKIRLEAVKRNVCVSVAFPAAGLPARGQTYTPFIDDGTGGGTACNGVQDGGETVFGQPIVMEQDNAANRKVTLHAVNIAGNAVCFNSRGLVCGSQQGNILLNDGDPTDPAYPNDVTQWYRITLSAAGGTRVARSLDSTDGTDGTWN